MRHGVAGKKFGRTKSHRRSLYRNMATSLMLYEKFETTIQKAKDLRRVVEKLITLAKVDTLANRRQAYAYLLDKSAVQKLFSDIGPRFKGRNGGYTRVLRTRFRHGDAASMAFIGFTEEPVANTKSKEVGSTEAEPAKKTGKNAAPNKAADKEATKPAAKAPVKKKKK